MPLNFGDREPWEYRPSANPTFAGDPIALGSEVGIGIESGRYARLVGIRWAERWDDGSTFGRYVIRCYRNDDEDGRPTGAYRHTGLLFPTELGQREQ
jgi:hypothetical protein